MFYAEDDYFQKQSKKTKKKHWYDAKWIETLVDWFTIEKGWTLVLFVLPMTFYLLVSLTSCDYNALKEKNRQNFYAEANTAWIAMGNNKELSEQQKNVLRFTFVDCNIDNNYTTSILRDYLEVLKKHKFKDLEYCKKIIAQRELSGRDLGTCNKCCHDNDCKKKVEK